MENCPPAAANPAPNSIKSLCSRHRFGIEQQPRHQHQTGKAGKETHNIGTVLSARFCEGTHRGIGCPGTDAAAQSHESRKKRCQIKASSNDAQRTDKGAANAKRLHQCDPFMQKPKRKQNCRKGESLLSIEASDSSRWSIA